jgi:plastocyanin
MSSWKIRSLVTGMLIVLLASACTAASDSVATAGSGEAASPEPQRATVVAVDYEYARAPAELEAGTITMRFENDGTVEHEIALSGIGDRPLDRFVEDLEGGNGLDGEALPDYLDQVAVPSAFLGVKGGRIAESTFTLTPGRYAMLCSYTDVAKGDEPAAHYQLGMIRELIVRAGEGTALPEADGTITARDYAFDVDIEAGDRSITFANEGPAQIHLSTVEVYPEGVDAAEAEQAFQAQLEPGPSPDGVPGATGLGFSGIFSDGLSGRFEFFDGGEFESGRTYLFVCFIADREGGKPHSKAYGMYEIVTIE